MTLPLPRILVVDDNRDAADILAELLTLHGMTARAVYGGAEAIAFAALYEPHLVLLDLGMPEVDGYAVARALRSQPGNQPYIVALTAWDDVATQVRVREAGFNRHVAKPSSLPAILRIIGEHAKVAPDGARAEEPAAPPGGQPPVAG
ncbi:response regulator receiver domain-containing protein [Pseudoduganella lurida]|uniref:Response regulator receiver domain-containing protein n=1 Tax=Pseudoduganella lurida TaxID=1036180 RepID=A0A562RN32_9BURK|nr:response regulator [Pseudoduganella lurida]TWI69836.1 response regulator receiver domain-containing protein [Pseudoduganella lurida]